MTARVTRADGVVALQKIPKRMASLKFKRIRSIRLFSLDRLTHLCCQVTIRLLCAYLPH